MLTQSILTWVKREVNSDRESEVEKCDKLEFSYILDCLLYKNDKEWKLFLRIIIDFNSNVCLLFQKSFTELNIELSAEFGRVENDFVKMEKIFE